MELPFNPLVAIDVGTSAIKIAELSGKRNKRTVKALGLQLIPAEAIVDGQIEDEQAVEKTCAELLDKLRINPLGRRVAVSLNGRAVEIKRISVDATKGELDETIHSEAEQYLTDLELSDSYFRYQILDNPFNDPKRTPVLIVAASRDAVEQYVSVIRNLGMKTGVVDCDALCIANMHSFNYENPDSDLVVMVNIGASTTQMVMTWNGQFLVMRDIPFGGDEYTRQISSSMGLDLDTAEAMKLAASQGNAVMPDDMQAVCAELNDSLIREIQDAVNLYFETAEPLPTPATLRQIVLTGGGSRIIGLDAAFQAALDVPCVVLNPFQKVIVDPRKFEMDYVMMQGHLYGTAIGLALRKMGDGEES